MLHIILSNGKQLECSKETTPYTLANEFYPAQVSDFCLATLDDKAIAWHNPLPNSGKLQFYDFNTEEGKQTFWHSAAHVMAQALKKIFPKAYLAFGPATENGFYYDLDLQGSEITAEIIHQIEEEFVVLAKNNYIFSCQKVSYEQALEHYEKYFNPYKIEHIHTLKNSNITLYTQGDFTDLCQGPHLPSTGMLRAFKVLNIAGAYFKGDKQNKMLTRVYGIAFPSNKELRIYLQYLEQAQKRDHRKLGKDLALFTFSEKVGMGLPLWLPKGALLRSRLQNFLHDLQIKTGYGPVITPHIGKKDLYVTSGHYEKYGEDSFQPIQTPRENELFFLKPMNCPHHCEIYKTHSYSYRDLPIRFAEFGTVYRYEQHGELHGLTRVRSFTQDDAHIFCRPDQVLDEFKKVIDIVLYVFQVVGFEDYVAQVSLRDMSNLTKYIGKEQQWKDAEQAIIQAAEEKSLPLKIVYGEAAFYGPKLDFMIRDAVGRKWQLGTIQVDYNLPERFDLVYTDQEGRLVRPVMIHRAPFGSLERFIAVLLEHTEGRLPFWLAPVQIKILPINDKVSDYVEELEMVLSKSELRYEIDFRNETINKKVRMAEMQKIPYILIIGEKEAAEKTIALRAHRQGMIGNMSIEEFLENMDKLRQIPDYTQKRN